MNPNVRSQQSKLLKEMNTLGNAISFKKYYVLRYKFSLTAHSRCILIFRCKYFSLKCSSIPTGKQNTPISNKNSDLSTSRLKVCGSRICSLKGIVL